MAEPVEALRILLIDDDAGHARTVQESMQGADRAPARILHAVSMQEAFERLNSEDFDVVLLALSLPDTQDLEAVTAVHMAVPDLPIVILDDLPDEARAVEAVRLGAQDWLVKGQVDGGQILRAIRFSIERNRNEHSAIRHLTHYDPLTHLPNRILLQARLEQALERPHAGDGVLALLHMDLDHFKTITDTLGGKVGEFLIQGVAGRLHDVLHAGDTLARTGDDEFTLLMPGSKNRESVAVVADKILKAFSTPFFLEGRELFVSASIGISLSPKDGTDPETLFKHADAAMFLAKQQGRNTCRFFSSEVNVRASLRLKLGNGLRHALARDQFRLHYQPQVSLASGEIVGLEALLRWSHPELGSVSPYKFIPVAEETSLILPIGEWVFRTACRQAQAWLDAGYPRMSIGVNLSSLQFRQPRLGEILGEALEESGLPPGNLELELTESCLMQNPEAGAHTLRELSRLGIHISVDDFGTGYSSLSYLKRFPIGTLKIDQSFIRDIGSDANDAAIVSAVIVMAHRLNMGVTAEGVETAEQLAFLSDHECDRIQGHYFSRAIPAEEVSVLLRDRTRMKTLKA